jgi:hypothetical protein
MEWCPINYCDGALREDDESTSCATILWRVTKFLKSSRRHQLQNQSSQAENTCNPTINIINHDLNIFFISLSSTFKDLGIIKEVVLIYHSEMPVKVSADTTHKRSWDRTSSDTGRECTALMWLVGIFMAFDESIHHWL